MGWQKTERTNSKKLDTPTPGTPLGSPAAPIKPSTPPTKPTDPSKPPYPYAMTPSEAQQYRWRWVEAGLDSNDTEEQWEAAAYAIEVLKTLGVKDVPEYIGKVERMMAQDLAFNRRKLRIAMFKQ